MTENSYTTIRILKTDKIRFREYAKHPKAPDSEVMTWLLNHLEKET